MKVLRHVIPTPGLVRVKQAIVTNEGTNNRLFVSKVEILPLFFNTSYELDNYSISAENSNLSTALKKAS